MKTTAKIVSLAAILMSACSSPPPQEEPVATRSLLTSGTAAVNSWPADAPGETQPMVRPYVGYPPLIPHFVAGLSLDDCADCHVAGTKMGKGHVSTKIPRSHYTNPFTQETSQERPTAARRNCMQCHAVQSAEVHPFDK